MTDAFGTEVDYPAGIFTMEAGSPPRGIGRVLQSSDGEARFMVYVEENEAHQSPAAFVRIQSQHAELSNRLPQNHRPFLRRVWSQRRSDFL
jgi:hypothetical protein